MDVLRPARVPNRTSRPPSCTLRQQHVTLKCMLNPGQSCLGSGSCLLLLQAPITDCRRPHLALQFHEWSTPFARCTPPPPNTTIQTQTSPCFHSLACPPTYSRPVAVGLCFCLALHKYRLLFPSSSLPCPGPSLLLLAPGFALRCDHPLTHSPSFPPYTPAATFYPPPAMRAACT